MFQTKFEEKIKTGFLYSITLFFENRSVYEIMWKNVAELGRPQMTI
jgi:5,10-methylenetetrahydrofolate reductase